MPSLKTVSAVLGRCFLLFIGLQILSVVLVYFCHEWAYGLHSQLFPSLTVEDFERSLYQMLIQTKTLGLMLFLIPWVAIKLVDSTTDTPD